MSTGIFLPSACLQRSLGVGVLVPLTLLSLDSVTKTNLSVHEDKNRVPFVKVRAGWALVRIGASGVCVEREGSVEGPLGGVWAAQPEDQSLSLCCLPPTGLYRTLCVQPRGDSGCDR